MILFSLSLSLSLSFLLYLTLFLLFFIVCQTFSFFFFVSFFFFGVTPSHVYKRHFSISNPMSFNLYARRDALCICFASFSLFSFVKTSRLLVCVCVCVCVCMHSFLCIHIFCLHIVHCVYTLCKCKQQQLFFLHLYTSRAYVQVCIAKACFVLIQLILYPCILSEGFFFLLLTLFLSFFFFFGSY